MDPRYESELNRGVEPARPGELRSLRLGPLDIWPPVVLAPMAGVTNYPFRALCRRFGAGLYVSEMITARPLVEGREKTLRLADFGPNEYPRSLQLYGVDPKYVGEAVARLVGEGRVDHVDMNFGCPVRKVTRTGAGATLLEEQGRAARIVEAIAEAVDLPVTVKLRRGVRNGSRACLDVGPRLVEAGDASLTLHPRSAEQMYTGTADHELTAELVSLVDVPVVASGDVTSRAKAQAVIATTGATAVMVGRGAQGNPWALREIMGDDDRPPTREEIAAELVLFIREAVRELGERRASSFLKKFYGWYLGQGRFPKPFKQELLRLASTEEVEQRLFAAAPGAISLVAQLEAEIPSGDEVTLELPISVYGGG
jgi:nifR3 family TIM-barrel protein